MPLIWQITFRNYKIKKGLLAGILLSIRSFFVYADRILARRLILYARFGGAVCYYAVRPSVCLSDSLRCTF